MSKEATGKLARGELALYVAEAMTSLAATWLSTGLLFVTGKLMGWGQQANLTLAAIQGVVYVGGALMSSRAAGIWGRKRLLMGLYLGMAGLTVVMMWAVAVPAVFVVLLMVWTLLAALNWPALEAMLCHGSSSTEVGRRVSLYNLVWAATGAVAIASISGVMSAWPMGVFVGAAVFHVASAVLVWRSGEEEAVEHAHIEAPPELLEKRELAKRLSRLALPASYTVIYALTPILAGLSVVMGMPLAWQSLAISVWLGTRVLTFWVMGRTEFWHTRPMLLMGAVVVMAGAFFAAAASAWFGGGAVQLAALLVAQGVLGVALGVIYSGSLYFGMVLSHGGDGEGGSTEQGGYHEAMIGAGTVLGPTAGVLAMMAGKSPALGVGAIVVVSVGMCAAAIRSGGRKLGGGS